MKLIDGPAAETFMVKRAPLFLRAVVDSQRGEKDVLDRLDDTPKATEKVFVYRLEGEAGWIHIYCSPRSKSGYYATGEYKFMPEVDGESVRTNEAWQTWVASREL